MENPYFNGHFQQLFVCSPEGKPSFKPMQSNVPISDLLVPFGKPPARLIPFGKLT